jgi:thymidine kinase
VYTGGVRGLTGVGYWLYMSTGLAGSGKSSPLIQALARYQERVVVLSTQIKEQQAELRTGK